jgi:hypothetical protein
VQGNIQTERLGWYGRKARFCTCGHKSPPEDVNRAAQLQSQRDDGFQRE